MTFLLHSIHSFYTISHFLLLILFSRYIANIRQWLSRYNRDDIKDRESKISLNCDAIVLDLNDIMNNRSQFLIINGRNKLLSPIDNAHNLPTEMSIAGYASISNLLNKLLFLLCGPSSFFIVCLIVILLN